MLFVFVNVFWLVQQSPPLECMYVCKNLSAPAHARTRPHRPAAPHQSSGVYFWPYPAFEAVGGYDEIQQDTARHS